MARQALYFAAAATALALAGCGSSSTGPKPAELVDLVNPKEVKVLWSSGTSSAGDFFFSPALVGDAIYVAGRDGSVARLDAADGREKWRVSTDAALSGGVGASARSVVVATEEGEVIALDADTGKPRWRGRVSSEVLAAPTVGEGMVLVRSIDNRIFGFGEEDGKRRWVYQRAPGTLILRTPAGVSIAGDTAFAGFSGGKLAAVSMANGAQRWEATVALPKGANELERIADVVGNPALVGREVCAATYQGRIACFEAASGRQLWARELSSVTGVSVDARYAFVADERGTVHAFDRSNGATLWKQEKLAYRQLSRPLAAGATVVVGDFEGQVHFLSRESGDFVARYPAGAAVRAGPLALSGAALLVQTSDGGLYALSP
ncbi:MAG TPA: outer membrane protein assembly factor BamB [Burkholderiales bacterium]